MMHREVVDDWGACPEGEIQRMVSHIRRHRRRQAVTRAAGVSAVLLLIFTIAATFYALRPHGPHGGLACAEVLRYLPDYRAGVATADLTDRIATHLENCSSCRLQYERMTDPPPSDDHSVRAAPPPSVALLLPGFGITRSLHHRRTPASCHLVTLSPMPGRKPNRHQRLTGLPQHPCISQLGLFLGRASGYDQRLPRRFES